MAGSFLFESPPGPDVPQREQRSSREGHLQLPSRVPTSGTTSHNPNAERLLLPAAWTVTGAVVTVPLLHLTPSGALASVASGCEQNTSHYLILGHVSEG